VDWSLAVLVAALAATGVLTAFSGSPGDAWVFAVHDVLGLALAAVLVWKVRRVAGRIADRSRWDRATARGLAALGLVAVTLATGIGWSLGGSLSVAGYNGLNWHWALGAALAGTVLLHALARAKPLRVRDVAGRRQFLRAAAVGAGAVAAWRLQRPASTLVGLRGAHRRFTGSYETGSFAGNAFPATSWVADRPRALDPAAYRLEVTGQVHRSLRVDGADLAGPGDEIVATLDCTGGFHSTQRWRGCSIGRLVDRAGVRQGADHVRVVSHTGYRLSFPLAEARAMLLATHVGDEPISHGHGAPVRLVAPGRRGLEWVKWVVAVEVHTGPDPGALASTVWSSFTPEGRGAA
jgi:DMSO/TMAO reductase YedYZ molybdopterin-dependent catalytic subunit